MGRPTKTYNRELQLIKKMSPGTAWLFPVDHPKGFMAKVYSLFSNELRAWTPKGYCRVDNSDAGVIVAREPEPKIPKEEDYFNAKS